MDRLKPGRLPQHLPGQLAAAFDQHLAAAPDRTRVERLLVAIERALEALEPVVHHVGGDLRGHVGSGGAGPRAVFEAIGLRIADRAHQRQRVFELGIGQIALKFEIILRRKKAARETVNFSRAAFF